MKQRSKQWLIVMTTVTAFGALGGRAALAQNNNSNNMGSNNMDSNNMSSDNMGGLPQVHHQGDVSYLSGGVGLDESHAIRAAAPHWPIELLFTGPGGEYLSDVRVRISDTHGNDVLDTVSTGPYMLVRIHPGHYTIHVSHNGQERTATVSFSGNGHARASFGWSS